MAMESRSDVSRACQGVLDLHPHILPGSNPLVLAAAAHVHGLPETRQVRGRRAQAANSLDRACARDELSRSARNWSTAVRCSATVGIWKTRRRKAAESG